MMKKTLITLAAVLAVGTALKLPAQAAPVTLPDGTVFDPEFYAAANPDVVSGFGTDAVALYQHYAAFGKAEGRLAYADLGDFDAAYYAQKNPDVVAVLGNSASALYQHYVLIGEAEGREARGGANNTAPTAETTPVTETTPVADTTPVEETTPTGELSSTTPATVSEVESIIIPYAVSQGLIAKINSYNASWGVEIYDANWNFGQSILETGYITTEDLKELEEGEKYFIQLEFRDWEDNDDVIDGVLAWQLAEIDWIDWFSDRHSLAFLKTAVDAAVASRGNDGEYWMFYY